jgi:hypothetical protein
MKPRSITKADLRRLKRAGACYLPEVGTLVTDLPLEDLEWAATWIPGLSERDRRLLYKLTGCRAWWLDGKRHRTDGPAIEHADDYRAWYLDGHLHRTDGPAVVWASGRRGWYLDGKRMTEAEHKRRTK